MGILKLYSRTNSPDSDEELVSMIEELISSRSNREKDYLEKWAELSALREKLNQINLQITAKIDDRNKFLNAINTHKNTVFEYLQGISEEIKKLHDNKLFTLNKIRILERYTSFAIRILEQDITDIRNIKAFEEKYVVNNATNWHWVEEKKRENLAKRLSIIQH